MALKILVVDRDKSNAGAIESRLKSEGYDLTCVATGEEGFYLANTRQYDLIIMGATTVNASGLEVVSSLREFNKEILILVLSRRSEVDDRIRCLRAGADDYLVEPYAIEELAARVEALLRRGRLGQMVRLAVSDLFMDLSVRRVTRGGESIPLTGREFDVLETLMRRAHKIVPRGELAKSVWKNVQRATPLDNVIDVHIAHLRRKIDKGCKVPLIHTARGVGFVLSDRQP